jgi:hypothetical protein
MLYCGMLFGAGCQAVLLLDSRQDFARKVQKVGISEQRIPTIEVA